MDLTEVRADANGDGAADEALEADASEGDAAADGAGDTEEAGAKE